MDDTITWRSLLDRIIRDAHERQRIARTLNVNEMTLIRWANGSTTPRPANLRQLLIALPQQRSLLLELLKVEFPPSVTLPLEDFVDTSSPEIPSGFYARILTAYAAELKPQRFWSLSSLILQQAIEHLDPHHSGMKISLFQCMPPVAEQGVRSLYEAASRGTPPWDMHPKKASILLGRESLAGDVVANVRPLVLQQRDQLYGRFSAHWVEWEESAAAYPMVKEGRIAGCLLASSTQSDHFTPTRSSLLQRYANIMLLAFEPEDFCERSFINLQPMPYYLLQLERLKDYQKRVQQHLEQANREQRIMQIGQAQNIVLQEFEEEFIHLPPSYGSR